VLPNDRLGSDGGAETCEHRPDGDHRHGTASNDQKNDLIHPGGPEPLDFERTSEQTRKNTSIP
jgi:hypothetical protein